METDNNQEAETTEVTTGVVTQPQPKSKPVKKNRVKRNEVTEEIYKKITERNQRNGETLENLCKEFNFSYSTFNNFKKKMEIPKTVKPKTTKLEKQTNVIEPPKAITQTSDAKRIKELESDLADLKEMFFQLQLELHRSKKSH